jgi:hypothetical protein
MIAIPKHSPLHLLLLVVVLFAATAFVNTQFDGDAYAHLAQFLNGAALYAIVSTT